MEPLLSSPKCVDQLMRRLKRYMPKELKIEDFNRDQLKTVLILPEPERNDRPEKPRTFANELCDSSGFANSHSHVKPIQICL